MDRIRIVERPGAVCPHVWHLIGAKATADLCVTEAECPRCGATRFEDLRPRGPKGETTTNTTTTSER